MIHHVGIVTVNPGKFISLMEMMLSKEFDVETKYIPEYKCHCAIIEDVEFVVPDEDSKIMNWVREMGGPPVIHHIAIRVEDLKKTADILRLEGIRLISDEPVRGVGNMLVNFIHPEEYGIMIELVEEINGH